MKIISKIEVIKTGNEGEIYNITPRIKEITKETNIQNGTAYIFTKHTTTAFAINENEERLKEDIKKHIEKTAPKESKYLHDDIELRNCLPDEPINGHSHIKALALNTSETIPIINGELALGKWQSILFFELDSKKEREIIVQIIGI